MKDVGFLGELWQQIRLVFYLIKDADVPIYLKILPFAGILYTLFPIDLIADVVPVLGQLDDLTILLIGAKVFIEMAPPQVVARYMEQMNAQKTTTVVEGAATDVSSEIKLIEGEIADGLTDLETEPGKKKGLFRR
ncbi:MAG: DUF1232 domain-containing protein [Candidatus Promineofilum sp.]|nr:DUF1232 domain-containing protein [Promineifilum sp.]